MGHTVGHLLPKESVRCGDHTIDIYGSFPHGFNHNLFTPGISPESMGALKSHHNFPPVHDPVPLPQPNAAGAIQMSVGDEKLQLLKLSPALPKEGAAPAEKS